MALSDVTDRGAVLAAIGEHDLIGREEFLRKYGYGPARRYILVHDARRYDSKAILGAAHGFQFPEQGPLRSAEFNGGIGATGFACCSARRLVAGGSRWNCALIDKRRN